MAGPDIGNKGGLVLFLFLDRSNIVVQTGLEFKVFPPALASQVLELQTLAAIPGDRVSLSPEIKRYGELLMNLCFRRFFFFFFLASMHELSLAAIVYTGHAQIKSGPLAFFPSSLLCLEPIFSLQAS